MKWEHGIGLLGLVLLVIGHGLGLFVAPREAAMGDVGRILYVHVPTAWNAMLVYTAAGVAAIGALWTGRRRWDAAVEACVEVGLLLNILVLIQGSLWGRKTWGIWWDWDPRLTTTLVMAITFAAVLLLRRMIDAPSKRMTASAVATVIGFVNVPVVYFSVRWWRTLHQPQSTPETVSSAMVTPLRIAAFGVLFVAIAFCVSRGRLALAQLDREADAPDLPPAPPPLSVESS